MTIQERQSIETSAIFQERYQDISLAEVIEQYEGDYRMFLQAIALIPEDKKSGPLFDTWGVNEIVTHIAHWNKETIRAIQAVQKAEIPWFFDDEEKINTLNKEVTGACTNIPPALLFENLEETHRQLIGFLQKLPEESFHYDEGRVWKNQDVTPALVCSYRHYLAHTKDILAWLDKNVP